MNHSFFCPLLGYEPGNLPIRSMVTGEPPSSRTEGGDKASLARGVLPGPNNKSTGLCLDFTFSSLHTCMGSSRSMLSNVWEVYKMRMGRK